MIRIKHFQNNLSVAKVKKWTEGEDAPEEVSLNESPKKEEFFTMMSS